MYYEPASGLTLRPGNMTYFFIYCAMLIKWLLEMKS